MCGLAYGYLRTVYRLKCYEFANLSNADFWNTIIKPFLLSIRIFRFSLELALVALNI